MSVKLLDGLSYRLREVCIEDAELIINIRNESGKGNAFINPVSDDVVLQRKWLEGYALEQSDHYFVIENLFSKEPEGLISLYNVRENTAEWGRWVLKKGSLSASESVQLVMKYAFETLCLEKVFSRTIIENSHVVSFHENYGARRKVILPNYTELRGKTYDAIEHEVSKSLFYSVVNPKLDTQVSQVFNRNLKKEVGPLEFHHIGIATTNIDKEFDVFRLIGYVREGDSFEDATQGIKGQFITSNSGPRLELLENISGSATLDTWLNNRIKMYHLGFIVDHFDYAIDVLKSRKAKIIKRPEISTYFGKRICFVVFNNSLILEIIERS